MNNLMRKKTGEARLGVLRLLAIVLTASSLAVMAGAGVSYAAGKTAVKHAAPRPGYVIGPEDVLEVDVWKNSDLSKTVIVRPDGKISLPLIGDVMAMGLTPVELRKVLVRKLDKYEQTAEVSVIVKEINSYKVFIFGDVNSAGLYSLKRRTSLLQAIALAGGFNKFASKNDIIVLRESANGGSTRLRIRFKDIIYGKDFSKNNIILRPGDTIFVP